MHTDPKCPCCTAEGPKQVAEQEASRTPTVRTPRPHACVQGTQDTRQAAERLGAELEVRTQMQTGAAPAPRVRLES